VTVRCAVLDDYQGALYGAQLGLLGLGKIGSRPDRPGVWRAGGGVEREPHR